MFKMSANFKQTFSNKFYEWNVLHKNFIYSEDKFLSASVMIFQQTAIK